jgi:hypothetical protein
LFRPEEQESFIESFDPKVLSFSPGFSRVQRKPVLRNRFNGFRSEITRKPLKRFSIIRSLAPG